MQSVRLEHGLFIAPYHAIEENPALALRRDLELVEYVDKLGYTEAWFGEHHSTGFEIISSPELMIAAAAEITKRIRLGTGVISAPYHNPLMTVDRILQLDHMTMGRAMFGFGPGLLPTDAMMLGIDLKHQRDMLVEALGIILPLLRGEEVTAKGSWYNLVRARAHLRPYTQPYPEIAVASAVSPSGGMLAGKHGFGMLCVAAGDPNGFDVLGENWKVANQVAAENGITMDPQRLRLVLPMYIAESGEKARQDVQFGLPKWREYFGRVAPPGMGDYLSGDPVDMLVNSGRAVIGTPDDAIKMIEKLQAKQGAFGVVLNQTTNWADFEHTKKSYELYARYVMPHFGKFNANRQLSYERMQAEFARVRPETTKAVELAFEAWKNRTTN
jgi:limonene 1,2-monooxygenase